MLCSLLQSVLFGAAAGNDQGGVSPTGSCCAAAVLQSHGLSEQAVLACESVAPTEQPSLQQSRSYKLCFSRAKQEEGFTWNWKDTVANGVLR